MSAPFSRNDFHRIRWSALLLLLLVSLGGGAVFFSLQLTQKAQAEAKKTLLERADIRGRLARARHEEQELRNEIARYQELVAHGYITEEHRLDWIEGIAEIKTARKLIDVQYELMPQKPVDAALLPEGAVGGGYEFMASNMKLHIQLLHEDDLLGFLADLRRRMRALIVVRQCAIERIAPVAGTTDRSIKPQLHADCELDWITLREKK